MATRAARTGSSPKTSCKTATCSPRLPVCGREFDGSRCRKRGTHFCVPRADHAQAFAGEICVHTKDRWARKPFILAPWQRDDIVRPLFGEVRWDAEASCYVRRFRIAWIEIARKNGKSELLAFVALYMLVGDGVESAEIYGCARDTEQAKLVFNVAARMVRLSPVLSRRLRVIKHSARIVDEKTNSVYAVVPSDALGNLGSNPSAVIFDEVLTQPNGDFWHAMRTGMGTRLEPLLIAATTAGNDPTSFAKAEHDECVKIAENPDRAPHRFVYLRNLPEDANPWGEANWFLTQQMFAGTGCAHPNAQALGGATNAVANELDWQTRQTLTQIARDVELTFIAGRFQEPSDNSTVRKTRGILDATNNNVITNAQPKALTEAMVLDLLQKVWESGRIQVSETTTLMCGATQRRALTNEFITKKNYREESRNVGGVSVDTIITDFGRLNVMLNRYMPADVVQVVSLDQCAPVLLETPGKGFLFSEPLARTGSTDKAQIYGEIGLEYGPVIAHGKITDLAATTPPAGGGA